MKKSRAAAAMEKIVAECGNDTGKQIKELKRLVREGQKSGDLTLVGAAYAGLAPAYYETGDNDSFFTALIKAVALLKDTDEYDLLAKSYTSLGMAYTQQGSNQMALLSDEIAYNIVHRHRIKGETRIRVYNNLSASYHAMGEFKKAVRLVTESLSLLRKDPDFDRTDLAMYSLNLSECYKDSGDTAAALNVLGSMSEWIGEVSFTPVVCDYYLRFALLSYQLGDTAAGDRYTDDALKLVPEGMYPLPIYDDLQKVEHILSKNNDRARAEKILGLMTVFAQNNKGTLEQMIASSVAADFCRRFGEFERASEYYAKYEEYNEKHMHELKAVQMNLHKTMKSTEKEIRRLKRKTLKDEALISTEPLTKLLNRSALLRVSSEFIAAAAKRKQKIGAIFIDIDYFKECNDTYGHARGDEIIREVAQACRKQETSFIRFARYGGDEFFGITRGLSDEEVCDVARRICRRIREADIPHEKNPNGGRVTLSAGVVNVAITENTDTILEIANYADKAVYYAKNAGKNSIYELVYGSADKENPASFVKIEF